ncbi:PrsW family intramembrane metalloprotease [Pseudoclavibacter sp. VKM Ac-2888]|uniref:PrsW family intramembrane metalloprotease n=1 Tax=Pseudoclavibacter sp. VKM Ac-2888 TaxID=2783830 RepID=UPI00188A179C|nr:PrsW family intramembrane metalloprotease [Pseudoclavibacter sp. VKM Ac-2888]MBF4549564.1 PrsW family intramembrane metalloprotease [Pseudoclavibacter sp. VKM Ac-2888]
MTGPMHADGRWGAPAGQRQIDPQFVLPQAPTKGELAMRITTIVVMCLAALIIAVVLFLAYLGSSDVVLLGSVLAALVPLFVVWMVVWLIDRWEPEPRILLIGAVFWGGGIAVGGALLTGLVREVLLPGALPAWWGPSVEAPVGEEIWKGLGLVVIYAVARRHFNGPTDGLVYGALLGAGFAFTENILYFSSMWQEAGVGGFVAQYFIRGIALPLLHPMCVSLTGIGMGIGARRGGWGSALGGFALGLIPAMALHALWNVGSGLVQQSAGILGLIAFFALIMVPIFLAWIVTILLLRRKDARIIVERLSEYAAVGWYSQAEIRMLSTMRGRSSARSWARRSGKRADKAMRDFITESTRLASVRHQVVLDPNRTSKLLDERLLLRHLGELRGELIQAQAQPQMQPQTQPHGASSGTRPGSGAWM